MKIKDKMTITEIEKLVEKYVAGETSLKEEEVLRTFFTTHDCPPHLQSYKALFGYFSKEKSIGLTNKIEFLQISGTKNRKRARISGTVLRRAVAAILILIAGGITVWQVTRPPYSEKEILLAKEQTDEALLYVSQKLNQAMSQVNRLNESRKTKKKTAPAEQKSEENNGQNQESDEK